MSKKKEAVRHWDAETLSEDLTAKLKVDSINSNTCQPNRKKTAKKTNSVPVERSVSRGRFKDDNSTHPTQSRDADIVCCRIEEGATVEGNYQGRGKWYKGKITKERSDGTNDIVYDDGELEKRVLEYAIRLLEVGSTRGIQH
jgi:hypothetical protein